MTIIYRRRNIVGPSSAGFGYSTGVDTTAFVVQRDGQFVVQRDNQQVVDQRP